MPLSDRQLLDFLCQMPFSDSAELAGIPGEPHATVHRALTGLLADGIVGRVSHGAAHLPSSQRYYLTAKGIRETAGLLGFATPSDFVRAYPVSREWLTLLIRRMDAVAAVYRLAASLSPGIDGLRSHVELHRRGRFDATITHHDGRSFGVVRQGRAGKTGPPPLAQILVGRQLVQHAGGRERPRQPRRRASHRVPQSEAGFAAPSRADGAGCGYLRHQPV